MMNLPSSNNRILSSMVSLTIVDPHDDGANLKEETAEDVEEVGELSHATTIMMTSSAPKTVFVSQ